MCARLRGLVSRGSFRNVDGLIDVWNVLTYVYQRPRLTVWWQEELGNVAMCTGTGECCCCCTQHSFVGLRVNLRRIVSLFRNPFSPSTSSQRELATRINSGPHPNTLSATPRTSRSSQHVTNTVLIHDARQVSTCRRNSDCHCSTTNNSDQHAASLAASRRYSMVHLA